MPYSNNNIMARGPIASESATGQGGQPGVLYYNTTDLIATVEAANYFNSGAEFFGVGQNIIHVVCGVGVALTGRTFVATRAGGVITLTRFTQAAAV
jgi:hypothetical protein